MVGTEKNRFEKTVQRTLSRNLTYGALGALGALGHYVWGTWGTRLGHWGTTYGALGALHQLCLDIFRAHKLDLTIINRKFWDNFKIQIGALVLILPKLEALTWGTITISPGTFITHKLNFTMI